MTQAECDARCAVLREYSRLLDIQAAASKKTVKARQTFEAFYLQNHLDNPKIAARKHKAADKWHAARDVLRIAFDNAQAFAIAHDIKPSASHPEL